MQVEEEDGYYSWAIGRQHLAVPLHSDYRWLDETDSAQEMSEPPAFSKNKPQETCPRNPFSAPRLCGGRLANLIEATTKGARVSHTLP